MGVVGYKHTEEAKKEIKRKLKNHPIHRKCRLENLAKIRRFIVDIKQGKCNVVHKDLEKIGLHFVTFYRYLRTYPDLLEEWKGIDWLSLYPPHCSNCKSLLTEVNYKNFDKLKIARKSFLYSYRKCNSCQKEVDRQNINSLYGRLSRVFCSCNRRSKIPVDFDTNYLKGLYNKQKGRCFYSGIQMVSEINSPYKISIDRVDSKKGYQKDNIVLCCWVVNKIKNNLSVEDFINICQKVALNISNTSSKVA